MNNLSLTIVNQLPIINFMSKKILIIEDDGDILNLLKGMLEDEGYDVTGLEYTESITKSINQYQPSLVILDFLLPGVNGGELCHEIKSQPATAHLPVIMVSGFPRVLESLGNYGCDFFIAKPFGIEEFLHAVSSCFDNHLAIA
jgi:DNA-binding response OmpR family regulator